MSLCRPPWGPKWSQCMGLSSVSAWSCVGERCEGNSGRGSAGGAAALARMATGLCERVVRFLVVPLWAGSSLSACVSGGVRLMNAGSNRALAVGVIEVGLWTRGVRSYVQRCSQPTLKSFNKGFAFHVACIGMSLLFSANPHRTPARRLRGPLAMLT